MAICAFPRAMQGDSPMADLITATAPTKEKIDQAFPKLSSAHIDRLRKYGVVRAVQSGEILFEQGDANVSFFVILEGTMEIVQPTESSEHAIADHGPSEFTGEVNMVWNRRALV